MSEQSPDRVSAGRLGVVLLDLPHYREKFGVFEPGDEQGLGSLPRGFFEHPMTWPVPTAFAVAPGATARRTLDAHPAAAEGLLTALGQLRGHCRVVITDCGFFWAARRALSDLPDPPLLSSGLELLELAARMTDRPIGILTFSAPSLEPLLSDHPLRDRLRVVGFSDLSQWAAFDCEDYATNRRWTLAEFRDQMLQRIGEELDGGSLAQVGALVIECSLMPQFGREIRELSGLPVLDSASAALAMLGNTLKKGTEDE